MACDLCGSRKGELVKLLDRYQTPEIVDLCGECETIVKREKSRLTSEALDGATRNLVEFMKRRRAVHLGASAQSAPVALPRPWWRRMLSRLAWGA